MSWKCVDVIWNFWGSVKKIIAKWKERSSSCSVTALMASPTSGGSLRPGFRFVVSFGAGHMGRICRIWWAGIPRSPCCNLLGWVGICGIMRNAWRRCRRSGG